MLRLSLIFLLISLLFPIVSQARDTTFSNLVQQQSLNTLQQIADDASRMNLRKSNQKLPEVLSRIRSTRQLIKKLGSKYMFLKAQNSYKPFAFIQTNRDRSKLLKTLEETKYLHQQYKTFSQKKNKKQLQKIKSALQRRVNKINRIISNGKRKVGNVYQVNNQQACHYFRPGNRFAISWLSCCDIQKGNKSVWTKKKNGKSNTRIGNCSKWGVKSQKPSSAIPGANQFNNRRVCRTLNPGERFYKSWATCCDIGNGKSRWKNRFTNKISDWKGSCSKWGVY